MMIPDWKTALLSPWFLQKYFSVMKGKPANKSSFHCICGRGVKNHLTAAIRRFEQCHSRPVLDLHLLDPNSANMLVKQIKNEFKIEKKTH